MIQRIKDFWARLNRNQRILLGLLSTLLILGPVSAALTVKEVQIAQLAMTLPVTPPVEGFGYALQINNEGFNDTYFEATSTSSAVLSKNPYTVEAWVNIPERKVGNYIRLYPIAIYTKPQSPEDYGYLFKFYLEVQEQSAQFRPHFSALITGNTYKAYDYISVGGLNTTMLKPDQWHHLAVTADAVNNICQLKLYVNGMMVDSHETYKEGCRFSTQNPDKLTIARPNPGAGGIDGYYYNGLIDELRFSKTVRYSNNFPLLLQSFENDGNTLALYHFDNNLIDSVSNHYLGVLSNHYSFVPSTIGQPSVSPTLTPTPGPTSTPVPSPSLRPSPSPLLSPIPTSIPWPSPSTSPRPSVSPKPSPSMFPSPTPTATPIPNQAPVITTTELPVARVLTPYTAKVTGFDPDKIDQLKMSISGLPAGLRVTQCQNSLTAKQEPKITCTISGRPVTFSLKPITVNLKIALSDNRGAVTSKTLPLTILSWRR